MSIVRTSHNKDNPYVLLNKKALEDPKISWASKGLWSYLMSRPDDWIVSVPHLSKIYNGKGGKEKAIYALLNELIENGYCIRSQERKDKGEFSNTEYVITEFKNKVPDSLQRVAVEGNAVEVTSTNKGLLLCKKQQQPIKDAVDVIDLVRTIQGLEDGEQEALYKMSFSKERIRLAIEFFKIEPVKKDLFRGIIWHCRQKIPPIPSTSKVNEAHKLAHQYNEILLKSGKKYLYQQNLVDIPKDVVHVVWDGMDTTISLKSEEGIKELRELIRNES